MKSTLPLKPERQKRPSILGAAPRLIALAGGVACCALAEAQIFTIPFPAATWKGSVEIRGYPSDGQCLNLYTAASTVNLRITDYTLDAYGSTVALPYQYICSGTPDCSAARSAYMTAPAGSMATQSFTTGILIAKGQTLSVCNYSGTGRTASWTFHGFLYTTP